MKIEQTSKNTYRVRKSYNGKVYTVRFDHKPTQKEVALALGESMQNDTVSDNGSFKKYALEYIKNRKDVMSPATVRTYSLKIKNQLSEHFLGLNLYDITSEDIQIEITKFSKNHAPKTVKSLYGFINTIITSYRPSFVSRVKLPQTIKKSEYEPNSEDIKALLDYCKDNRYSIPFQLGVLGLRRGEICALSIDDLSGNELTIHRSMVYLDGKWIAKESPKTDSSNRTIYLPDSLVEEIQKQGCIFDGHPNALNKAIHRYQNKLGIPQFKFHTLRSYFASYAHSLGIPDSDIMAIGGWSTDSVMKSVYRKSLEESKKESMKRLTNGILGNKM